MTAKTKNWSEGVTFILLLASAKYFVLKRRRKDWLILFVVSVASSQQGGPLLASFTETQNSPADLNARVLEHFIHDDCGGEAVWDQQA